MLDILFIHTNSAPIVYQKLSEQHTAIEPPVWAGMLANHCRINGFSVQILDAEVKGLTDQQTAQLIRDVNPRIACFVVYGQHPSASSQNMEGAISTAEMVKQISAIRTLFVGGYVAALPLEVLKHDCVDMVCQNEGVYTINDLLEGFDLSKIQGLGYKESGQTILNPPKKIVPQDKLEQDLPGVAWDLLPSLSKYRTSGWHSWANDSIKNPFASLYTSLGCPFKCSFCMINIINRIDQSKSITSQDSNIFRYWSPKHIIKDFDYFAEEGVTNIKIADEMFVLKEQHFLELCKLIIERKYNFNIWAYSRIDTCKPQHLDILREAGVKFLGLGIENPNQILRKEVVKGGFKDIKITDVVNTIRSAGIYVAANYMFGLPFDTHKSMQNTLDFAMDLNTEMVNFNPTMAFPGSPLYLTASKNSWELPNQYAGYSYHSYYTQNLPTNHLTSAEVLSFRDYAWMKYHTNSRYIKLVKDTFGDNAVNNLKKTCKIKLKRKILGD